MPVAGPVGFDLDLTPDQLQASDHGGVVEAVVEELGVHIDLDEVDPRMGIKLEDEVSYWFPAERQQAAADSYPCGHYVRLAPSMTLPLPGAAEALSAVRLAGERGGHHHGQAPGLRWRPSLAAVALVADDAYSPPTYTVPEKAAVLASIGAAVYHVERTQPSGHGARQATAARWRWACRLARSAPRS